VLLLPRDAVFLRRDGPVVWWTAGRLARDAHHARRSNRTQVEIVSASARASV